MLKSDCAPAISAIERSPPVTRQEPALVCLSCGNTMKHVQTIPRLGVRPRLLVFVCPSCREVGTTKAERVAQANSVGGLVNPSSRRPSTIACASVQTRPLAPGIDRRATCLGRALGGSVSAWNAD
jgi:hypothetical protein